MSVTLTRHDENAFKPFQGAVDLPGFPEPGRSRSLVPRANLKGFGKPFRLFS